MRAYGVRLKSRERATLHHYLKGGNNQVRVLTRCRILLLSEKRYAIHKIADLLHVTPDTVFRTQKRYRQMGLAKALKEKPRTGRPKRFKEKEIQQLVALACSEPPQGYARWTHVLLAEKAVARKLVPNISPASVGRLLSQHRLKPWRKKNVVRSKTQ